MARTTMTTSDALRKQQWESTLFRDTIKETYFVRLFAGQAFQRLESGFSMPSDRDYDLSGPNDIVHVKMNLKKQAGSKSKGEGDKITFGLVPRIDPATNPGVTTGQTLKGKEVALSWYNYSIELARYRQAVSLGQPIDWHRSMFPIPEESRAALNNWGIEKMELLCHQALDASPTKTFYKTSSGVTSNATYATALAAITDADSKLTPAMVDWIAAWAKTGGGRGQIPLRPVKIKGRDYYVLLVYPDVIYDWRQDSSVQQAWREAEVRGSENPIFSGAKLIYNNVVIHENENVTVGTDGGGAAVPYAHCHLMGAQSLCWAWGEMPSIVEDDEDYQEDHFAAWRVTCKVGKPKFNSVDYGSVSVVVSRSNVAGS